MALRRLPLTEQHWRGGTLEQVVDQRRIFRLRQVDQPEVGLAGGQGFLVETLRVAVEHDLIATGGQRLLQHVTLQRGIGDHGDACGGFLAHFFLTSCWMDSSSNDS